MFNNVSHRRKVVSFSEKKRAPVQSNRNERGNYAKREVGTIEWWEHELAWEAYVKKWGNYQSAERIAERHGFGYNEISELLGHEPTTWEPWK